MNTAGRRRCDASCSALIKGTALLPVDLLTQLGRRQPLEVSPGPLSSSMRRSCFRFQLKSTQILHSSRLSGPLTRTLDFLIFTAEQAALLEAQKRKEKAEQELGVLTSELEQDALKRPSHRLEREVRK